MCVVACVRLQTQEVRVCGKGWAGRVRIWPPPICSLDLRTRLARPPVRPPPPPPPPPPLRRDLGNAPSRAGSGNGGVRRLLGAKADTLHGDRLAKRACAQRALPPNLHPSRAVATRPHPLSMLPSHIEASRVGGGRGGGRGLCVCGGATREGQPSRVLTTPLPNATAAATPPPPWCRPRPPF